MAMMSSAGSWSVGLLLGVFALGCTPGGVGDPCTPEDEYQQTFNGFQVTEVNIESRSFQCETRLCLVNHFQGRVSCRVGQSADVSRPYELGGDGKPKMPLEPNPGFKPVCPIPGTEPDDNPASLNNIVVEVPPQLVSRQTDQAVYCSCRCDGPDANATYCECPEGFQCQHLVDDLQVAEGSGQLPGSYCIRSGSEYDPDTHFKGAESCQGSNAEKCGCTGSEEDYPSECGRYPTAAATP